MTRDERLQKIIAFYGLDHLAWSDEGIDEDLRDPDEFLRSLLSPIDMVLHCPACGLQHIDAPWKPGEFATNDQITGVDPVWTNPPHRSHLCHGCGHIWRPADVPTNGVAAVKTKGKADSPIHHYHRRIDWQQRCLDLGFEYVRAPDDHYVECTQEQATELLRSVIGVDVHMKAKA